MTAQSPFAPGSHTTYLYTYIYLFIFIVDIYSFFFVPSCLPSLHTEYVCVYILLFISIVWPTHRDADALYTLPSAGNRPSPFDRTASLLY